MAKEYFSHDYNTRLDGKIKLLLIKHGYEGYGIFWGLVEDLFNNKNSIVKDYLAISYDYRVSEDLIKSIVEDFDLFKIKGEIIFSESVKRRLKERDKKSEKARKSIQARWAGDTNVIRTNNERNTNKGKEKKGKESKVNKSKEEFKPPSFQEVESFFSEKGYSAAAAKKAFDYYDASNWVDSKGNQVKNWKQKMIAVWFKPENAATATTEKTKDDHIREQLQKQQLGLNYGG